MAARAVNEDGGAAARNAAVGKLEIVVGFATPADEERGLRDGDGLARLVRSVNFKHRLGVRGTFDHGIRRGQIVTFWIEKTFKLQESSLVRTTGGEKMSLKTVMMATTAGGLLLGASLIL